MLYIQIWRVLSKLVSMTENYFGHVDTYAAILNGWITLFKLVPLSFFSRERSEVSNAKNRMFVNLESLNPDRLFQNLIKNW